MQLRAQRASLEAGMFGSARRAAGIVVTGAAIACAGQASAQSLGFMALPSTVPQFFGFGYGAGHHTSIVRTPAQQPPRMDRCMKAPACYGPLYPEPYAPIGCYGGACHGPNAGMPCAAAPAPGTVPISRSPRSEMGTVPLPAAGPRGPVPTVTYQAVRPVRP
jgi:hypothetical protein